MSEQVKENFETPPEQKSPTAPVWIFALTLLLLFVGGVYFDRNSGWFDSQVYAPYGSSDNLELYQPKSGLASKLAQGKLAYSTICAACHGDDGMGKPGQFPPLAGSEWVKAASFKRVEEIPQLGLNGSIHVLGQDWNSSMAPMGAGLSDADLAAVLTYIRKSWGNNASEVDDTDVKAMRAALAGHPAIGGEAGLNAIKE
ncbi:MAG TPA: cytochrome c [Alphaproteobacteria bacterium]|nr:cytochrome c [Alphaproteobacteria bacterium]